jgi:hypothetical protein
VRKIGYSFFFFFFKSFLILAIRTDDYFNENHSVDFPGNNEQRICLALTFQIDADSNKLIISDMGEVSLTKPEEWNPANKEDDAFFLLESPLVVSAPTGDDDGVNLPWFDTADAVLMFHFLHRDHASVRLRVVWRENGQKVEVWPDVGVWVGFLFSFFSTIN